MNRRQFIAGASVGVAAAASGYPKPAIAQGARELKMVTIWPKGLPGLQSGADRVAQSITALSGGRLQVKVFPAGQLVGAMESFDAVSSGLADFYHGSEVTWAGKSATFAYFCNVPFGFTADELNAWVYDGGGQALWDELSAGFGLKAFLCGNTGPQMGGWFNKELKDPADLKGVKMRIGGWAGKTLGKLGVVAQQIAGGDIYPALEKGTIDAAEWVGPYDDEKLGFYKVVKFYYYPGWWEGGTTLHLLINQAKFNELPKNYQAIVTAAAGFANVETTARYDARNPQALKRLVAAGTQLRPFSQSIMEACLKASNEVNAETSAVNPDYKKVWDSIVPFRNDAYLWWQVAEYGYDSFMIRSRPHG